jgi:carbamoylphosphate synthase small subunit
MNQKLIDQLLHKAGARFGAEGTDYSDFTSSKFAELIVRECIDIAKNWEDQLENTNLLKESNAVGIVGYRIARNFGVKE